MIFVVNHEVLSIEQVRATIFQESIKLCHFLSFQFSKDKIQGNFRKKNFFNESLKNIITGDIQVF